MSSMPMSFGTQEFGEVALGDTRRTRRLIAVADACVAHPDRTLPDKFHDPRGYHEVPHEWWTVGKRCKL